MKYLLLNRNEESHLGGDSIQLRAYQKELIKLGHEADYKSELFLRLKALGYDEAFIFHCNFGWNVYHWQACTTANLPYSVFAIFYPGVYSDTNHDRIAEILGGAKKVFCLSNEEAKELSAEFPGLSIRIINNGVDKEIFTPVGEKAKSDFPYLLSVGRVEEMKGHMITVKVAQALGMDAYIIGPKWSEEYKDLLLASYNRVHVLDPMHQTELAKYYRGAEAYICGSGSERNSLTVLEAASCGIPVINSTKNRGKEWLSAPCGDPASVESYIAAVKEELANPKDRSAEVPSWADIVNQILN
jgi:glycosyltransferase involved in cell wall biosynthesis